MCSLHNEHFIFSTASGGKALSCCISGNQRANVYTYAPYQRMMEQRQRQQRQLYPRHTAKENRCGNSFACSLARTRIQLGALLVDWTRTKDRCVHKKKRWNVRAGMSGMDPLLALDAFEGDEPDKSNAVCKSVCRLMSIHNIDKSNRRLLQLLLLLLLILPCVSHKTIRFYVERKMRVHARFEMRTNFPCVDSFSLFLMLIQWQALMRFLHQHTQWSWLSECVFRTQFYWIRMFMCACYKSSLFFLSYFFPRVKLLRLLYSLVVLLFALLLLMYIRLRALFSVSVAVNVSVSHIRCMDACDELCVSLRDGWAISVRILCVPISMRTSVAYAIRWEVIRSFGFRVPHSFTRTPHAYVCISMVSLNRPNNDNTHINMFEHFGFSFYGAAPNTATLFAFRKYHVNYREYAVERTLTVFFSLLDSLGPYPTLLLLLSLFIIAISTRISLAKKKNIDK